MSDHPTFDVKLDLRRPTFSLNVDLALPAQGVTVLFGPSGSGKTTLLRCVAGLERGHGRVSMANQTWQDDARAVWVPTFARDLGYVFQEASLFEHLDVKANLKFGVTRVKKATAQASLAAAIDLLGIAHLLNRRVDGLSGGERQRVAIARALATEPRILLLDEPLASLDIARRQEIMPWLERLHREMNLPMLYVTHNMEELTRLADHVVLLNEGHAQLAGSVSDVLSNPSFAVHAGGEAGAVLLGTVTGHDDLDHLSQIDLDGSVFWVRRQGWPIGTQVRLHVHADDVSLAVGEPDRSSIQNKLPGVIEAIDPDTHLASRLVTVRHHRQKLLARVTAKAIRTLGLSTGTPVWAQIKSMAMSGASLPDSPVAPDR